MTDSIQDQKKAPYQDFAERLIDAMLEAGYGAREGSWSRLPVEIEPLRREAQAKSLTTARKYLEGEALPRRPSREVSPMCALVSRRARSSTRPVVVEGGEVGGARG